MNPLTTAEDDVWEQAAKLLEKRADHHRAYAETHSDPTYRQAWITRANETDICVQMLRNAGKQP